MGAAFVYPARNLQIDALAEIVGGGPGARNEQLNVGNQSDFTRAIFLQFHDQIANLEYLITDCQRTLSAGRREERCKSPWRSQIGHYQQRQKSKCRSYDKYFAAEFHWAIISLSPG